MGKKGKECLAWRNVWYDLTSPHRSKVSELYVGSTVSDFFFFCFNIKSLSLLGVKEGGGRNGSANDGADGLWWYSANAKRDVCGVCGGWRAADLRLVDPVAAGALTSLY